MSHFAPSGTPVTDEIQTRERTTAWLVDVEHAFVDAVRSTRRRIGLLITVSVVLGLAIGGNAAMFSVLDRLWLQPPVAIRDPDSIVRLYFRHATRNGFRTTDVASFLHFQQIAGHTSLFDTVAAYARFEDLPVGAGEASHAASVGLASANFFSLLGVRPALGRFFTSDEDTAPEGRRVVVLSYDTWRGQHLADARALGSEISIGGAPFTIIGVAPRGFTGATVEPIDYWVPLSTEASHRVGPRWYMDGMSEWLTVIGRVRTTSGAIVPFETSMDARQSLIPGSKTAVVVTARPIIGMRGRDGNPTRVVGITRWLSIVGLLILIAASANVANLLLVSILDRRRELAVRVALGASRRRLLLQLCTESFLLAVAAAVLAVVTYWCFATFARAFLLPDVAWPSLQLPGIRVIAAIMFAAGSVGLLLATFTVAFVFRRNFTFELRGPMAHSQGRAGSVRRLLLGVQSTLAMLLLVASGTLVMSLHRMNKLELGFHPDSILVARANLGPQNRESYKAFYEQAAARLDGVSGIRAAAMVMAAPFTYTFPMRLRVTRADSLETLGHGASLGNGVSENYFSAVGARLRAGRLFDSEDRAAGARSIVVNETLAMLLHRAGIGVNGCVYVETDSTCTTVVGVVANMYQTHLDVEPEPEFFIPFVQRPDLVSPSMLVIAVTGSPDENVGTVRRVLLSVAPSALRVDVKPMREIQAPQVRPWVLGSVIATAFAVLAVLVALLGVHAVFAYVVRSRQREFSVRIALGAPRWRIAQLVFGPSVLIATVGIAVGLAVTLAVSSRVSSLLFSTSPTEGTVVMCAGAILLIVAVIGSLIPAIRAANADAAGALRQ